MKYKAGDVVKLRDDLEGGEYYDKLGFHARMCWMKNQPIKIINIDKDGDYKTEYNWYLNDEMIEGLWEECKGITYEPYKEKTNKYKLIDILNKIADGELKEGTQIIWDVYEYTYKKGDCYDEYLERKVDEFNYVDIIDDMALRHLNAEVELIEPHHIRDDTKIIEPTDNTTEKIEELKQLDMDFAEIDFSSHEEYARCAIQVLARKMTKQIDKLNEVIRVLNKRS